MSKKNEQYQSLIDDNLDKKHISFSEFSLFSECQHRHLIEKYLGIFQRPPSIHLFFGNAIHESIELSIKNSWTLKERTEHFKVTFTKEMFNNMKDTLEFKNEFQNFLVQGEQILMYLDVDKILDEYDLVSVEEPLYEKLYGIFYFKGFIDIVLRHKITKRYRITDWKTSGEDWDVDKKKQDEIFLCQMRFYKFFWCRKNNVPLDDVDCVYVVLNRLKNKKNPNSFPGNIQKVEINSTKEEVKVSLEKLVVAVSKIHVQKTFEKIKFLLDERNGCKFCPLKGGKNPLCDNTMNQYKKLLLEHKK